MRVAVSLLLAVTVAALLPWPVAHAQTHVDSLPIKVQGDAQLRNASSSGVGTLASPLRIEWKAFVTTSEPAIQVTGTRLHLVIANVSIQGAGADAFDGIRLVDAQNVTIESADIQFARTGISLQQSSAVTVRDSTIRAGAVGVLLEATSGSRLERNRIAVNAEDVSFRSAGNRHATGNVLRANELSIATGQVGFSFASAQVYDNDIDASNVVNFVPVRWYTHLAGTPSAPVSAPGEVYVKGITNVGQIVCYDCTHVRFEANNATSGVASGLVIEQGRNVTIAGVFAQGNDAAGIMVRNSQNVTVTGASLHDNGASQNGEGGGLRAVNVSRLEVVGITAAANRRGISVEQSPGARITGSTVERSAEEGILLATSSGASTSGNVVRDNAKHAIRVTGGRDVVVSGESLHGNDGAGVSLSGVLNATVATSRIEDNARGGVVFEGKTLTSTARSNTLEGNGEAGIVFADGVALNRAEDNTLADHARHIRFARQSEQNTLVRNSMSAGPGQVGLHFDDETAYNNNVTTSNTVGGTAVQWHVALVGRPDAPLILRDLRVETENVTNVAQILVYKSSYVHLLSPVAAHGAKGVYALQSSSLTIDDARANDTPTGIHLAGTQTAFVRRAVVTGAENGVRLERTQNVTVSDVSGIRTDNVVLLDADSRGARVERTNASGARRASLVDPTASGTQPRNLVADAGLDKLAGAGRNVTFSDAIGAARFGSERIVRQTWSFGDGEVETSDTTRVVRPVHVYATAGEYVVRYELETADGIVLTDTANVRIVPPPEAPPDLVGNITAAKNGVQLNWSAPQSEFPITGYTVYRGLDPNNLTKMLDTVNNATTVQEQFTEAMRVFYAISASTALAGEGPLTEPFELVYTPPPPPPTPRERPTEEPEEEEEPPAEEGGKGAPLPPWLALVAVAAVAALLRRQTR